jgi:hypothetical protein
MRHVGGVPLMVTGVLACPCSLVLLLTRAPVLAGWDSAGEFSRLVYGSGLRHCENLLRGGVHAGGFSLAWCVALAGTGRCCLSYVCGA